MSASQAKASRRAARKAFGPEILETIDLQGAAIQGTVIPTLTRHETRLAALERKLDELLNPKAHG